MNDKEQKKLIDRNGVREAIGKYDGTQKLSEDEIRIALRAIDWINASANNSQAKLSENSGVSSGRLSPFFAGKYVGDTHGVVEELGAFLIRLETEGEIAPIPFVETSMWKRVKSIIDNARFDKQPGMLFGESQMGKTACLEHYRDLFPLSVKYYRFTEGLTYNAFLGELLRTIGERNIPGSTARRRALLAERIKPSMTLLLDEIQLALRLSRSKTDGEMIIECIRTIADTVRCGVVYCGTRVAYSEMTTGDVSPLFNQTFRRCQAAAFFDGNYSLADLRLFWEAVNLPEPADLAEKNAIKALVQRGGLTAFISLIQRGRRKAIKAKQRFSWDHFNQATRESERLAVGSEEEVA